ncbi:MAG: hypothetical protein AAGJ69_06155 [Cyanobacteria bacterium J06559_1]
MTAPFQKKITKNSLVILAAIAVPFVMSDRASAASEPLLKTTNFPIQTDTDTACHDVSRSEPSAIKSAVLVPAVSALPTPTFHAQALPLEEDALTDPFDDGFLTPEDALPDESLEELEEEVGEIRPLPTPEQTQRPPQPNGQLLIRSSAFTSSNVTGSDLDSADDLVFVNGATLLLTPKLGPDTRLVATAGGGLTRFATEGENNYNSLDFSAGVQHRFSDTTYGQIGWVNSQLYNVATGEHTLSENSARLLLGRQDRLDEKLRLDTSYELRARFSDPDARSRISNTLATRLRYDFSPDWQGSVGYRLAFSEYTQNGRADTTHQLQAATTYTPTQDSFVTGFASYAFGNSSETTADLSNLSFGVGVGVNLPLF